MARPKSTVEQQIARAISKFDKRGENECWPWTGEFSEYKSMPVFRIKYPDKPTATSCNPVRLVYAQRIGPVHPTRKLYHRCGNKTCGNPDHLYQAAGSTQSWRIKNIPIELAEAVKEDKRPDHAVAAEYGVTPSHVAMVRRVKKLYIRRK